MRCIEHKFYGVRIIWGVLSKYAPDKFRINSRFINYVIIVYDRNGKIETTRETIEKGKHVVTDLRQKEKQDRKNRLWTKRHFVALSSKLDENFFDAEWRKVVDIILLNKRSFKFWFAWNEKHISENCIYCYLKMCNTLIEKQHRHSNLSWVLVNYTTAIVRSVSTKRLCSILLIKYSIAAAIS